MGIREIKDDLLGTAKKDADKLVAEGKAQAEKILAASRAQTEGYRKRLLEDAERIISDYERKQSAAIKFQTKRQRFSMEKELMEKVMDEARKRLADLPSADRKKHIQDMLTKIQKEFEIGVIYTAAKDISHAKKFDAESANIIGGVIAENREGTQRIDYSYEALLNNAFEKNNSRIAKVLFG